MEWRRPRCRHALCFDSAVIMTVAVSIWDGRVSPVLDSAQQLLVVEADGNGTEVRRRMIEFPDAHPMVRARFVASLGVDTIICGAVSRQLESLLTNQGVAVSPWVKGGVDEVIDAYLHGKLYSDQFVLPGCMGGGRGKGRARGQGNGEGRGICRRGGGSPSGAGGQRGKGRRQ